MNENDLIRRGALIEWMYEHYSGNAIDRGIVISAIKNSPAVDAVEVVHAKWENSSHHQFPVCGYCGRLSNTFTNYCPCCGACMDAQTDQRPETGEGEKDG